MKQCEREEKEVKESTRRTNMRNENTRTKIFFSSSLQINRTMEKGHKHSTTEWTHNTACFMVNAVGYGMLNNIDFMRDCYDLERIFQIYSPQAWKISKEPRNYTCLGEIFYPIYLPFSFLLADSFVFQGENFTNSPFLFFIWGGFPWNSRWDKVSYNQCESVSQYFVKRR